MRLRDVFASGRIESSEVSPLKKKIIPLILFAVMAVLLLNTGEMQHAVGDGIELCLLTVIPALFPFLLLSNLLMDYLPHMQFPFSRIWAKILRIPEQATSIFFLGLLVGYPLGAKLVSEMVKSGRLSNSDGKRMLCFCSNAGPAFLFGIGMTLFSNLTFCLLMWCIQIFSAVSIAVFTPGTAPASHFSTHIPASKGTDKLPMAVKTMSLICAWVIIFRMIIRLAEIWLLKSFPDGPKCVILGILELTNGCCELKNLTDPAARWVIFSALLAFGGLCVALQTASFTDIRPYLMAKPAQAAIAATLAAFLCPYPIHARLGWAAASIAVMLLSRYGLRAIFPKIATGKRSQLRV